MTSAFALPILARPAISSTNPQTPFGMTTDSLQPVHVPAGTNAHNAPTLNVLGMSLVVKMQHAQTCLIRRRAGLAA